MHVYVGFVCASERIYSIVGLCTKHRETLVIKINKINNDDDHNDDDGILLNGKIKDLGSFEGSFC